MTTEALHVENDDLILTSRRQASNSEASAAPQDDAAQAAHSAGSTAAGALDNRDNSALTWDALLPLGHSRDYSGDMDRGDSVNGSGSQSVVHTDSSSSSILASRKVQASCTCQCIATLMPQQLEAADGNEAVLRSGTIRLLLVG